MIASRFSTASGFSILAMIGTVRPLRSISARHRPMSAGERTKERPDVVDAVRQPEGEVAPVLRRSAPRARSDTPGRLMPLCSFSTPPSTTSQRRAHTVRVEHPQLEEAVVDQEAIAGRTSSARCW